MNKKINKAKLWTAEKFAWLVVFVAQVALSAFAFAGVRFLLQPVDPILANVIGVCLVGCLFYISYRSK